MVDVEGRKAEEYAKYLEHVRNKAYASDATSKDREHYADLMGWRSKDKKKESDGGIKAEDYQKLYEEFISAIRGDLQEFGGVCPLCKQPYILPEEVRNN